MKFENCKDFSIDRDLPVEIRKKIKEFFNNNPAIYYQHIYQELFTIMPVSLQMEISLNSNKELVKKVTLFNLGSPFFVFSVFK